MRQLIYILLLILGISCGCTGKELNPPIYAIKISNQTELNFLNYNNEFKLYSKPRLNKNGVIYKIEGYDDMNFSGIDPVDIKLSKNKNYLKMDHISKGYVELSDKDSILHENYQCVIISIKDSKVVWYGVEMCDGEWKGNQWISNDQIQFEGK